MYNICVVLARRGIFVKNDKYLVWNSLIGRILIRSRPLLLSPSGGGGGGGGGSLRLELLPLNKSISEKEEKSLDGT